MAVLAVPTLSAMGFGDDPSSDPAPADQDATGNTDDEGPVALVTEGDTPQRVIASLSTGRDLRNDAEAADAAQAAADAAATDATADADAAATDAEARASVARAEVTTTTTAAPVTAPPTTAAPEPPPTVLAAPAPPPITSGVWDSIAACESGGNWAINTGNGYYGGLQFLLSTWQLNGGTEYAAYPHQASRQQQIAVAERVVAASGGSYGAWGGCAASLGLP